VNIGTDCLGTREFQSGIAAVSGMRHVDGMRHDINLGLLTIHSITPNTPESVKVQLTNVVFNELSDYSLDPNQTSPSRAITLHGGSMSALVEPITGEEAMTPGTFDIATRVARLQSVNVTNAPTTIVYLGKTFNVHVDSASLSAFSGSYARTGEKNSINGSITVSGSTFTLDHAPLDPAFDQMNFDASYACTPNLKAPIPPAP
jgi:hypothetical protein